MSSLSKLTVSLSLLTLIPLHAMEEKNIDYKRRGKQKVVKQKEAIDNKFRREATNLMIGQVFHILNTGKVPATVYDILEQVETFSDPLPKGTVINDSRQASIVISNRVNNYFSAIMGHMENNSKGEEFVSNMLVNAKEIYRGDRSRVQIGKSSDAEYSDNFFSDLVLNENVVYFLKKYRSLLEEEVNDFNNLLMIKTQDAVSDHSLKTIMEEHNDYHKKLVKAIRNGEKKDAEIKKLKHQRNVAICVAVGTVTLTAAAGATAYATGNIKIGKNS